MRINLEIALLMTFDIEKLRIPPFRITITTLDSHPSISKLELIFSFTYLFLRYSLPSVYAKFFFKAEQLTITRISSSGMPSLLSAFIFLSKDSSMLRRKQSLQFDLEHFICWRSGASIHFGISPSTS